MSGNGVVGQGQPCIIILTPAGLDQASSSSSVATIPLAMTIKVTDALGNNVSASSLPRVSMDPSVSAGALVPQAATASLLPGSLITFDAASGTSWFNLKTKVAK